MLSGTRAALLPTGRLRLWLLVPTILSLAPIAAILGIVVAASAFATFDAVRCGGNIALLFATAMSN